MMLLRLAKDLRKMPNVLRRACAVSRNELFLKSSLT